MTSRIGHFRCTSNKIDGVDGLIGWDVVGQCGGRSDVAVGRPCEWSVEKLKVKHPALRVPPGGNQVDGLPPAAIIRCSGNLQNEGLQHSGKAKDLKWRLN